MTEMTLSSELVSFNYEWLLSGAKTQHKLRAVSVIKVNEINQLKWKKECGWKSMVGHFRLTSYYLKKK